MQKLNKRGMFENLNPMALSLITFIIIVSSGAVILTSFQDTTKESMTATNEQITLINGTAVSLANDEIFSIINNSNNSVADLTLTVNLNYTINSASGTITLNESQPEYNGLWNWTYSYNGDTLATNITGTGLEATEDLANWSPTIVVIGVASFIIALVAGFGVYSYAKKRR